MYDTGTRYKILYCAVEKRMRNFTWKQDVFDLKTTECSLHIKKQKTTNKNKFRTTYLNDGKYMYIFTATLKSLHF